MIALDRVLAAYPASDKKTLLSQISQYFADLSGVSYHLLNERLMQRERLGSTGLGDGIAVPHAKIPGLDRVYGVFVQLPEAIHFDALDHQPVDLVYAIIAPQTAGADHLRALSSVSRRLRDPELCDKIRGANSEDAIRALVAAPAKIKERQKLAA